MEMILPRDVQYGLDKARRAALDSASRLRIVAGGETYKVLRMWKTGFAIDMQDAPHLRGRVDVHDGGHHLMQCLIVAGEEVDGEKHFEFKRATRVLAGPPLDFARNPNAPVGLISVSS